MHGGLYKIRCGFRKIWGIFCDHWCVLSVFAIFFKYAVNCWFYVDFMVAPKKGLFFVLAVFMMSLMCELWIVLVPRQCVPSPYTPKTTDVDRLQLL